MPSLFGGLRPGDAAAMGLVSPPHHRSCRVLHRVVPDPTSRRISVRDKHGRLMVLFYRLSLAGTPPRAALAQHRRHRAPPLERLRTPHRRRAHGTILGGAKTRGTTTRGLAREHHGHQCRITPVWYAVGARLAERGIYELWAYIGVRNRASILGVWVQGSTTRRARHCARRISCGTLG